MNPEHLRKDWFIDRDCPLYQNPKHFCFNTDSILLAQFAKPRRGERILEIGCNNAAVLLWMDRFDVKELHGVEILKEPAELARLNLEIFAGHPWKIYSCDVKDLQSGSYDLVLSNPPFFPLGSGMPKEELDYRQLGRFEVNLDLNSLIREAARQLRSNGRFILVHRPDRLTDILKAFDENALSLRRFAAAYDWRDQEAKSILLEGIKEGTCSVIMEKPVWIGKDS
ncbi:MAG: methyltransferase [Erysipelotrichaceae bacterium]|nr:methyltransferase [Erysipelotrichaceae bacterium]